MSAGIIAMRKALLKFRLSALRGAVLPLLLLVWWEYLASGDKVHSFVFVPLETVAASLGDEIRSGDLLDNWLASLTRTSVGFLAGGGVGIALGAVLAISRIADRVISPIYTAIRQVPLLGWIPLISLWFGNGEPSKYFIIAFAAFNPTVLNTYEGLRNVDRRFTAVAQVFQATRWQVLRHITLPAAMPAIYIGLMHAIAFAWLSSIGGEFFFNPGPGLGNMMMNGQTNFRMDLVFLGVISVALTGYGMNQALAALSRLTLRWRPTR